MGAYNIRYAVRQALKAQALANFIAALAPTIPIEIEKKEEWKVWTDGASSFTSSRIGILLQGPH